MPLVNTLTLRVDGALDAHPEGVLAIPGASGLPKYSGAFRAVRCHLATSGTYAAGGTALTAAQVGLTDILGVLELANGAPAARAGQLRFNTATKALQLYAVAGTELGAVSAVGDYEVIIFGRT